MLCALRRPSGVVKRNIRTQYYYYWQVHFKRHLCSNFHLLFLTSRKPTSVESRPAVATWLKSWRSLWYGQRVNVPFPRWVILELCGPWRDWTHLCSDIVQADEASLLGERCLFLKRRQLLNYSKSVRVIKRIGLKFWWHLCSPITLIVILTT